MNQTSIYFTLVIALLCKNTQQDYYNPLIGINKFHYPILSLETLILNGIFSDFKTSGTNNIEDENKSVELTYKKIKTSET